MKITPKIFFSKMHAVWKHFYGEPSYRNESSDSVSRLPPDQIGNAFNIKFIFRFYKVFVTLISSNSAIYNFYYYIYNF